MVAVPGAALRTTTAAACPAPAPTKMKMATGVQAAVLGVHQVSATLPQAAAPPAVAATSLLAVAPAWVKVVGQPAVAPRRSERRDPPEP